MASEGVLLDMSLILDSVRESHVIPIFGVCVGLALASYLLQVEFGPSELALAGVVTPVVLFVINIVMAVVSRSVAE